MRGCPGKGDLSEGLGNGPGLKVMVRKKQADGKWRWEAWMLQARLVELGWLRAWEVMQTQGAGESLTQGTLRGWAGPLQGAWRSSV